MDLDKRLQLEKIYRKRRMIVKGITVVLLLMAISFFFKNYLPRGAYLGFIFLVLFFILQFRLAFLIRKIPPLLCESPSFTGEQYFVIFNKSIIYGTVFTLFITAFFLISSKFLILTVEFVCVTIIFSTVISSLVAFLILDKKERKKAKLEIENNSKK